MSPTRVLILDDDTQVRVSLSAFLEDAGYEVFTALHPGHAFDLLAVQPVDVVVVDLRLPGMDGQAFILTASELQPRLRYLIYTGSTGFSPSPALARLGLDERTIFRKPVADLSVIVDAIDKLRAEQGGLDA